MFSATVGVGSRVSSWLMETIPRRRAAAGDPIVTALPSHSMILASGWCSPHMIFARVDLPEPFSPVIACTCRHGAPISSFAPWWR